MFGVIPVNNGGSTAVTCHTSMSKSKLATFPVISVGMVTIHGDRRGVGGITEYCIGARDITAVCGGLPISVA